MKNATIAAVFGGLKQELNANKIKPGKLGFKGGRGSG